MLVSQNIDDGFNAVAEIILLTEVHQQPTHPRSLTGSGAYNPSLNTSEVLGWDINPALVHYGHVECTPLAPVAVRYQAYEDDSNAWAKAVSGYFAVVTIAGIYLVNPVVIGAGAAASTVFWVISLNGDDNLGLLAAVHLAAGDFTAPTAGGDDPNAFVRVVYSVKAANQGVGACPTAVVAGGPEHPRSSQTSQADRDLLIAKYEELRVLIHDADLIEPEEGNPAGLTPIQIQENRDTIRDFVWAISDTVTTYQVAAIEHVPSAHADALSLLGAARDDRSTQPDVAMAEYRDAALIAFDTLIGLTAADPAPVWLAQQPVASPNPFFDTVRIRFVPQPGTAPEARIYDARGRLVRVMRGAASSGSFVEFVWDGRDQEGAETAPGVYWVRARMPGGERSGRISKLN